MTPDRCAHCDEQVSRNKHGHVVGFHQELTCHKSPIRLHEVRDEAAAAADDHKALNPDKVSIVLDRAALERLRDVWEGNDGKSEDYTDIVRAVRDVFEGQDGMLLGIDRVLGATGRR